MHSRAPCAPRHPCSECDAHAAGAAWRAPDPDGSIRLEGLGARRLPELPQEVGHLALEQLPGLEEVVELIEAAHLVSVDPLVEMLQSEDLTDKARAFAAVALCVVADKEDLPWNSKISVDINYRANTTSLTSPEGTGILDIL